MMRPLMIMALALLAAPAFAWQSGRATWFDVYNNDLTTANCQLSWDQINTGSYVAALSDKNPMFGSSCGMCLELRCQNAGFRDGYNEYIDRTTACKSTASIYATVADACPCNYPNNAYSNERWCCGDDPSRRHIDITQSAFQQLADLGYGVIGIEWRQVDCSSRKPTDGSAPTAPEGTQTTSEPLPSSQDAYKAREAFAPFTTPATMTVAGGLVEGQLASAHSMQQEAEQRAAALKKEAESRFAN